MVLSALAAIFILNPNSEKNFFLEIVDQQSHLIPGLVVAFFLGMFWKRANGHGACASILLGPVFSAFLSWTYPRTLGTQDTWQALLGSNLNTFHRVGVVVVFCLILQVLVSLLTARQEAKEKFTWTELGGHPPGTLRIFSLHLFAAVAFCAAVAWALHQQRVSNLQAGLLGSVWVAATGLRYALLAVRDQSSAPEQEVTSETPRQRSLPLALLAEDRTWAALLCSLATFILLYYY